MEKEQKRITIGSSHRRNTGRFYEGCEQGSAPRGKASWRERRGDPRKISEPGSVGQRELRYEYQYNTIFSYAEKEKIDALLVLAGSIGYCVSTECMKKMLTRYKVPCVLIASQVDGFVDVSYDNCASTRQALSVRTKNSDKPYNVTVSAGAVRIDPEEEMTLEEALAKADQKLYIAKQHRKKEVAK